MLNASVNTFGRDGTPRIIARDRRDPACTDQHKLRSPSDGLGSCVRTPPAASMITAMRSPPPQAQRGAATAEVSPEARTGRSRPPWPGGWENRLVDAGLLDVRNATYRRFVELGRAPSAEEVAGAADLSSA